MNTLLNKPDAWFYIIVIVSIPGYTIRSTFNSWQDRKAKEAEARVKQAELELTKQRERPKFAAYQPLSGTYEDGLAPLQQEEIR